MNITMIIDTIDSFVLNGNNFNYPIDALIYGTPNDFLWLTRKNIIEILTKKSKDYCFTSHFS